jgi:hypothetical protein
LPAHACWKLTPTIMIAIASGTLEIDPPM